MTDPHPRATTETLRADGAGVGDTPAPHGMATDRLALRRVHPDEVDPERLHALYGDVADAGEVFALCGWDEHGDEAETRAYLDRRGERWERGDFYEYVLEATGDGEFVGAACLEVVDDGACEFGLWLRKPYWGRGLAGEGTDALVHAAFRHLDAPFVVAGCLPDNDRSRRAIEKFVGRYGGAYYGSAPTVPSSSDPGRREVVAHHEWVVTRDQFDAGQTGISCFVPGVEYGDVDF